MYHQMTVNIERAKVSQPYLYPSYLSSHKVHCMLFDHACTASYSVETSHFRHDTVVDCKILLRQAIVA